MTKNVPTKTLIDAFPGWFTGEGIFSEMTGVPWASEVDADLLDMDYFGNHSGWKKCSPLVYKLFDDEYELSDAVRTKLADLVTAKFLPNWIGLWNTYHFDYDPLTDYDVLEEGERESAFQKSRAYEHEGTRDDIIAETTTHGHTISEVGSQGIDETSELTHGESISEETETSTDEDITLTHGESISEGTEAASEEDVTLTHGEQIDVSDTVTTEEDMTLTHGEVIDTEGENASTETLSRWGFNTTVNPVPSDKRDNSGTNSSTETHSGNDVTDRDMTVTKAETTTHSGNDVTSREVSLEESKTTTHSGNDVTAREVALEESKTTTHSGKDTTTTEKDIDETRTTTHGGADTNRTVVDSANTASDTTEDSGSDTDEYTKHFSGLKGYTTRQELIERERALWRENFFDRVYSDVDTILASLIYKREHRVSPYAALPFEYYSI